jgi:hypothetical protein
MSLQDKWIELYNIMLCEISQVQKDKGCMFFSYMESRPKVYVHIYTYIYTCIGICLWICVIIGLSKMDKEKKGKNNNNECCIPWSVP